MTGFASSVVLVLWIVAAQPAPTPEISNGAHSLRIEKITRGRSFDGRMQTRSEDLVFLSVYLSTKDECFDGLNDTRCFTPPVGGFDKVAKACGSVQDDAGKAYEADGGGTSSGGKFCNYIVPKEFGRFTLRLTGYPELKDLK